MSNGKCLMPDRLRHSRALPAPSKYFNIVGEPEFPIAEPISWSKAIFLLEKD